LALRNFRCFTDCTIELHPQFTVVVAENGFGKTALLDAFGIALGTFVDALTGSQHFHKFDRSDVRLVQGENSAMKPKLPTEFVADGYILGQPIRWSRALLGDSRRARTTRKGSEDFTKGAREFRDSIEGDPAKTNEGRTILPLIAFYGTGRLWSEHRLTEGKRKYAIAASGRLSGYTDCLSSSSSFKGFVAWYENKMNEIGDARFKTESFNNVSLVRGVQEAVRVVLTPSGWCDLNWDSEKRSLFVEHASHGRLPLTSLSDGVRNMIGLIADVARRCASLNPHLSGEAAQLTPGVLLIDEVDMHLHPRWQQTVVDLLRKAFPSLQMIVSTHSPHVLSTVDSESIRVIRLHDGHGVPEIPPFQTRGVESADILAKVMDVDPVPQIEPARWLRDYRALIQTGEYASSAGARLFEQLVAHFGEKHPVLIEVETLRRLQEFRHASKLPPQQST
jgi:predicted ATP-binding protein involved in virulence